MLRPVMQNMFLIACCNNLFHKCILFLDGYNNRRNRGSLPFSRLDCLVQKPLSNKYIANPQTIVERIRNKRLELRLLQKDVAHIIGVTEDCITNWEKNRAIPQKRYKSSIIKFLEIKPLSNYKNSN